MLLSIADKYEEAINKGLNTEDVGNRIVSLAVYGHTNEIIDATKKGLVCNFTDALDNLVVRQLSGKIVENVIRRTRYGYMACIYAARNNHIDTVVALTKLGARIDEEDENGKTVLDYVEKDEIQEVIKAREEYEAANPESRKIAEELKKKYYLPPQPPINLAKSGTRASGLNGVVSDLENSGR